VHQLGEGRTRDVIQNLLDEFESTARIPGTPVAARRTGEELTSVAWLNIPQSLLLGIRKELLAGSKAPPFHSAPPLHFRQAVIPCNVDSVSKPSRVLRVRRGIEQLHAVYCSEHAVTARYSRQPGWACIETAGRWQTG